MAWGEKQRVISSEICVYMLPSLLPSFLLVPPPFSSVVFFLSPLLLPPISYLSPSCKWGDPQEPGGAVAWRSRVTRALPGDFQNICLATSLIEWLGLSNSLFLLGLVAKRHSITSLPLVTRLL